ncbi:MAG: DNA polymerase I [Hyphomicrobiales bacterium]|nr:DNA polymerase I [Hyphomicrobiales bacterium]
MPAISPDDHLVLVDGSGYIFRAYHALPPLTRKSDGLPVGAVAGFCNMLWRLLRDKIDGEKATHIAVIFDSSSDTFRNQIYDQYKANRTEPPEDLRPQFGLIRAATRAFDLPSIEMRGFEADDLIATYARIAAEAGANVTIISSDKDLMQLINDRVTMFDTMKDKRIDAPEVIEKFGVPPDKVVEVQSLSGDSVDNVPGVPGIGIKTAAQLVAEYGDLEGILAAAQAGKITQTKRRESLIEHAEKARISKKLVMLDANVPLEVPIGDLRVATPDPRNLIAFLKAMEFNTVTRRVAEAYEADASAIDPDPAFAIKGAGAGWGEGDSAPDTESDSPPSLSERAAPKAQLAKADPVGTSARRHAELLAEAVKAQPFRREAYETVRTPARLAEWVAMAREAGVVAIDTETTSLDAMVAELVGFSLAVGPNVACYVPLLHRGGTDLFGSGLEPDQIGSNDALTILKPLLEDPSVLKVGQNLKYDWLVLSRHDIAIQPADDTMLMSYVLDAGINSHGMDKLSERHLGHATIPFSEVAGSGKSLVTFDRVAIDKATTYAAEDADVTLRLWRIFKARLAASGRQSVYETLERPLVPVLARMERRGVAIDRQILSRLSGDFAQKAAALEDEIQQIVGEKFNVGSPKQLGDILFGKLGLPGGKKTVTGQWATGAGALEDLAEQGHVLPARILDWRQLTKLKSTYTDALPTYLNAQTGRIHTSFSLAATTTGRLSSSEPNLQNIPVRNAEGRQIRTAFIPEKGMKLVSADYSQIELRLLAHIADIPQLRQAFADGIDIHAMTASEMFGVPVKDMPAEVRRRAKAINFGIIYGISAFGLANQLGISREEAGAYIRKYFERFPGIRAYMDETKAFVRANGFVTTIFGRVCHYPDASSSNPQMRAFVERQAINAPIQGSASDIIRRAMIRMEDALESARLNVRMLLQVHDELVFEVPDSEGERALPIIRKVMVDAPLPALALKVPLQVDARAAGNWDEAH